MINSKKIEELRTKKELIKYFKQRGKNITEEDIDVLKQSYDKVQENSNSLTIQQLDKVVGGVIWYTTRDGKIKTLATLNRPAVSYFNKGILNQTDDKFEHVLIDGKNLFASKIFRISGIIDGKPQFQEIKFRVIYDKKAETFLPDVAENKKSLQRVENDHMIFIAGEKEPYKGTAIIYNIGIFSNGDAAKLALAISKGNPNPFDKVLAHLAR